MTRRRALWFALTVFGAGVAHEAVIRALASSDALGALVVQQDVTTFALCGVAYLLRAFLFVGVPAWALYEAVLTAHGCWAAWRETRLRGGLEPLE